MIESNIRFYVFAHQVENKPWIDYGKGHVGSAVVDVQMAAWNRERVEPVSWIQMDSNHSNAPRLGQCHLELKLFHEPTDLLRSSQSLNINSDPEENSSC